MITIYVRGIYLPGFELVPAVSMIALAAAVAGRRFIGSDEEEGHLGENPHPVFSLRIKTLSF